MLTRFFSMPNTRPICCRAHQTGRISPVFSRLDGARTKLPWAESRPKASLAAKPLAAAAANSFLASPPLRSVPSPTQAQPLRPSRSSHAALDKGTPPFLSDEVFFALCARDMAPGQAHERPAVPAQPCAKEIFPKQSSFGLSSPRRPASKMAKPILAPLALSSLTARIKGGAPAAFPGRRRKHMGKPVVCRVTQMRRSSPLISPLRPDIAAKGKWMLLGSPALSVRMFRPPPLEPPSSKFGEAFPEKSAAGRLLTCVGGEAPCPLAGQAGFGMGDPGAASLPPVQSVAIWLLSQDTAFSHRP